AAGDGNLTATLFDQLLTDPKPDTRTDIDFRGEEGFEDFLQMLSFDTNTIVTDDGLYSITGGIHQFPDRNVEGPSLRHGLNRVRNDIGEHLQHFSLTHDDLLQIVEAGIDSDAGRNQLRLIHGEHILHQLVKIDL